MAIIYSYPIATPELQDLLVGTEMAEQGGEGTPRTRTFTIDSIISLAESTLAGTYATVASVNLKANIASPTFTGTLTTTNDAVINLIKVGRGGGNVDGNTAVGASSLASNTTGIYNTTLGYGSLNVNETGSLSVAIGMLALTANVIGDENTAVGTFALEKSLGNNNTAVGTATLYFTTTGSNNTAIGRRTCYYGNFNNTTSIGYNAQPNADNQVVIGDENVTTTILRGAVTADSFAITEGLSTEYLMADGSTFTGGGAYAFPNLQQVTTTGPNTTIGITATTDTNSVTPIKGINNLNIAGVQNSIGVYGESPYNGIGVKGTANLGYGIYGKSNGSYGVYGVSLNSSTAGVRGEGTNGFGVQGYTTSGVGVVGDGGIGVQGNGITYGIYGITSSGSGVYGRSTDGYGGRFYSSSSYAVYAEGSIYSTNYVDAQGFTIPFGTSAQYLMADGTTSTTPTLQQVTTAQNTTEVGISATTNANLAIPIKGVANWEGIGQQNNIGVLGEVSSSSSGGVGVQGVSTNNGIGVRGLANLGYGVYGQSSASNGIYGVSSSESANIAGVYGEGSSVGVYGYTVSGTGVKGVGATGVYGGGDTYGIYGEGATGIYGQGTNNGVHGFGDTGVWGVGDNGAGGFFSTNFGAFALISNGSAAKPGGGTWSTYSDSRIKQNITPYAKGLAEILLVNTVNFEYNGLANTKTGIGYVGIIAQDMKEVFPETIGTYKAKLNKEDEEETELYMFDANALTFALINAVKQLSAEIELLKSK